MLVSVDFETRSPVDLKTCGAFVYFDHPRTEVLMAAYRIDDAPIRLWTFVDPPPLDLWAAIESGATLRAWNAQFEALGFDLLADRRGWPRPRLDQFVDTMAAAAAMSLPRALGQAAEALGTAAQKNKDGWRLIRKFSMPRRDGGWNDPLAPENLDDWKRFCDYCVADVLAEEEIARRIVPLSDAEQAVWVLDQTINRRGIRIDTRSARAAIVLAEKAKADLDAEMLRTTGGYVRKCSEVARLTGWVEQQGVSLASAAKADIADLLACDDLPEKTRRALEIRQEAAKTSVAKITSMLERASSDSRVRGSFLYHGASTGRWSSTGVNFANMPRPRRVFDDTPPGTDVLFRAFRAEDPRFLRDLYGDDLGRPLHLISDSIRGFIWGAPGHDLVQADYSGIEGAVIAWLAGETWKLDEMFAILADPTRPDLYRQTAASIMSMSTDVITKKHPLRQSVGKVSELACFTAETQVLTQRGPVSIVEVLPTDKLWDGLQWVTHQGVISKGVRPVVNVDGIGVTPDHLIRTGATWTEASRLASDPGTLAQALATGSESLKSLATTTAPAAGCGPLLSSVPVERSRIKWRFRIFERARPHVAGAARSKQLTRRENRISATMMSSPTRRTDAAFSTGSRLAYSGAKTLATGATPTTAGAAYQSIGGVTEERFWSILSRWRDGIIRRSNSTESTSTRATHQETFGSSPERSTPGTGERPAKCKSASTASNVRLQHYAPVFDIAQAGPRNRFTIFSNSGALVVHNCGFGGGVPAFYSMARNFNVDLDALYAPVWVSADEARRERALKRYETCLRRGDSKADVLSMNAWLACEIIKIGWREANAAIAQSWRDVEAAITEAVAHPGTVTAAARAHYIVSRGFLWARLPSGRCLAYGAPRLGAQVWTQENICGRWVDAGVMAREDAEKLERTGTHKIVGAASPKCTALGVDSVTKKWTRFNLYGGLAVENLTQAVARDLLVNGMLRAEAAGYPIIAHVYDEIICEVPRGTADLDAFERLICELPEWAAGLPLTAGGWIGKRYRKA